MALKKQLTIAILLIGVLLGLAGYSYMSAQVWTSPTSAPPYNNVLPPINVGVSSTTIQSGSGALVFNRFAAVDAVWSDLYCDSKGENCWSHSTGTPGGGGGGDDTITVGGKCFQPAWAVGCMWNWSGDGNDTSIYIKPTYIKPSDVCASVKREYQYHYMILARCFPNDWLRTPWVQVGTTNKFTRTVSCAEGATGAALPEASCTGAKPATTCTDLTSTMICGIFAGLCPEPSSASCPS